MLLLMRSLVLGMVAELALVCTGPAVRLSMCALTPLELPLLVELAELLALLHNVLLPC